MELNKSKVLVVGLGKTGQETVRFLIGRGADVRISDINARENLIKEIDEFEKQGVYIETGFHSTETFLSSDLIVLSPGVSINLAQVRDAMGKGIEVISETELAYRFINKPVIAVTGSNGKTTTCNLIARIFESAGKRVFLGGNIGTPLIQIAKKDHDFDVLVLELSSFQIQFIRKFKPYIGIILNISPNHLDHHENFEEYVESKMRLFSNQTNQDWAVYNADDVIIKSYLSTINSRKVSFGKEPKENGVYYDGKLVRFESSAYDLTDMKLIGTHNIENSMAAVAAARIFGCPPELIEREIREFAPLPHRIEFVRDISGARFYNDSKSTSPNATLRALESFSNGIILISGGKDKGLNFDILKDKIEKKVKYLILFGESRFRIQKELGSEVDTALVSSLEDALEKARVKMKRGDTVLFSPACSSFDMFISYEERGRIFKEIVQKLPS